MGRYGEMWGACARRRGLRVRVRVKVRVRVRVRVRVSEERTRSAPVGRSREIQGRCRADAGRYARDIAHALGAGGQVEALVALGHRGEHL